MYPHSCLGDWWKSPLLQGDDNMYGEYDYLIEEIPNDVCKWEFGKRKCTSCGKERYLHFYSEHYFRTMDGYDSLYYYDCWVCMLRDKIHSIKRKISLKVKTVEMAIELYRDGKKSFSHYYELAKKIVR